MLLLLPPAVDDNADDSEKGDEFGKTAAGGPAKRRAETEARKLAMVMDVFSYLVDHRLTIPEFQAYLDSNLPNVGTRWLQVPADRQADYEFDADVLLDATLYKQMQAMQKFCKNTE